MLDPLLSHTVAKPERETFRYEANWHRPAAGTFESVPQGPLDATNQLQHLPPVSSRHNGDTKIVWVRWLGSTICSTIVLG